MGVFKDYLYLLKSAKEVSENLFLYDLLYNTTLF